jgi:hypothetical protein
MKIDGEGECEWSEAFDAGRSMDMGENGQPYSGINTFNLSHLPQNRSRLINPINLLKH